MATNWLKKDKCKWILTFQTVEKLQNMMKQFNDEADQIFDELNENGNDARGCAIDMQQRLDGGKCQITHVVAAKKMHLLCYRFEWVSLSKIYLYLEN